MNVVPGGKYPNPSTAFATFQQSFGLLNGVTPAGKPEGAGPGVGVGPGAITGAGLGTGAGVGTGTGVGTGVGAGDGLKNFIYTRYPIPAKIKRPTKTAKTIKPVF